MQSETMKKQYLQPSAELIAHNMEYALMAASGNKKFDTTGDGTVTPPGAGGDDDNPVGPSQSKGGIWDDESGNIWN